MQTGEEVLGGQSWPPQAGELPVLLVGWLEEIWVGVERVGSGVTKAAGVLCPLSQDAGQRGAGKASGGRTRALCGEQLSVVLCGSWAEL